MNTLLLKIITFLRSLFWHCYAGFPKSTIQQINDRMNICETCEMLDKKYNQCLICGCNINREKKFMNKLAWADQECPLGKWQKLV